MHKKVNEKAAATQTSLNMKIITSVRAQNLKFENATLLFLNVETLSGNSSRFGVRFGGEYRLGKGREYRPCLRVAMSRVGRVQIVEEMYVEPTDIVCVLLQALVCSVCPAQKTCTFQTVRQDVTKF